MADDSVQRSCWCPSWTVLAAITAAVCLTLPQIVLYFQSNGLSPRLFSDGDEALYLPFAVAVGKTPVAELVQGIPALNNDYLPLGYPTPHNLTELVVGKAANFFGLSAAALGLLLDFLCVALSYIFFATAFSLLTGSSALAHLGTLALLAFPAIFPLTGHLSAYRTGSLSLTPFSPFPCLPILRAVGTQLSYVLLGFTLLQLVRCQGRGQRLIVIGLMTGCLLYVYFFAWAVAVAFVSLFLLLDHIREGDASAQDTLNDVARFGLPLAFASAPGLAFIAQHHPESFLGPAFFRQAPWYLPPEILVLVCGGLLMRGSTRRIASFIAAAGISELLLVNAQKILGVSLQPYHFAVFYLHPLLTALCIVSLGMALNRRLRNILIGLLFGLLGVVCTVNCTRTDAALREDSSLLELLGFLRTLPSGVSVTALPFDPPFTKVEGGLPDARLLPYWISALTGHFAEPTYLGHGYTREDLELRRELLIGRLFTGKAQLAGACPEDSSPMGDLISENFSWHRAQRRAFCERAKPLLESFDICQALGELRPDYVVAERTFEQVSPALTPPELIEVWRSTDGKYRVLRVDTERMIQDRCEIYALRSSDDESLR